MQRVIEALRQGTVGLVKDTEENIAGLIQISERLVNSGQFETNEIIERFIYSEKEDLARLRKELREWRY